MHAHYVHTCHGVMWRSKGGQFWGAGSLSHHVGPRDLSLLSVLASRAFVSRAISLARGEQFKRTDWSEAAGSEIWSHWFCTHSEVAPCGRAWQSTDVHLLASGKQREKEDETRPSEACCPMAHFMMEFIVLIVQSAFRSGVLSGNQTFDTRDFRKTLPIQIKVWHLIWTSPWLGWVCSEV